MAAEQLEPRRMIVVGAGGVGGWLCEGLARMLEFRIPQSALVIVDGDNYEPKNHERQSFQELGNKAQVKARQMAKFFPNTFIVPDSRWVVDEVKGEVDGLVAASDLLAEGDVVYAVVDNFAARKAIFDAAREFDNIDVFTGGNDDQLFGSVYHYQRRDGKDITDHPVEWHSELENPPDRNPGELSCQERAELEGGTQLLATNMTVAGFLLGRTEMVILNGEEDKQSEIMFDLGEGLASSFDRTAEVVPAGVS